MGFQELDIARKSTADSGTGVMAGLSKINGRKARLRVSLRKAVLDEAGWIKSSRFRVLVGSGDDAGMIRLQPDEAGPGLLTERPLPRSAVSIFGIALGHVPSLPDIVAPRAPCQWKVLDGRVIEIALPGTVWRPVRSSHRSKVKANWSARIARPWSAVTEWE